MNIAWLVIANLVIEENSLYSVKFTECGTKIYISFEESKELMKLSEEMWDLYISEDNSQESRNYLAFLKQSLLAKYNIAG